MILGFCRNNWWQCERNLMILRNVSPKYNQECDMIFSWIHPQYRFYFSLQVTERRSPSNACFVFHCGVIKLMQLLYFPNMVQCLISVGKLSTKCFNIAMGCWGQLVSHERGSSNSKSFFEHIWQITFTRRSFEIAFRWMLQKLFVVKTVLVQVRYWFR